MTRLNRLYQKKLAQIGTPEQQVIADKILETMPSYSLENHEITGDVNIIDEDDGLLDDHQLSMEQEYPAGEGDSSQAHRPGLSGPGGNLPKIEGASEERSAILALMPTEAARKKIASAMGGRLHEAPEELHITLAYLGKGLSDEDIEKVSACLDAMCPEYDPLECRMQGLGVFDHTVDGGRPFYASIDALGMAKLRTELLGAIEHVGVAIEHKYDFTPHMTLGYIDASLIELAEGSPGVEWVSDEIVLMNGGKHTKFKLGSTEKQAGGFGYDLQELDTPSVGGNFEQPNNQLSENTQEDPDLKLGEVEEPYSIDSGPQNFRFEDGDEYNIVKGAELEVFDNLDKWGQVAIDPTTLPNDMQVVQDQMNETNPGGQPVKVEEQPDEYNDMASGLYMVALRHLDGSPVTNDIEAIAALKLFFTGVGSFEPDEHDRAYGLYLVQLPFDFVRENAGHCRELESGNYILNVDFGGPDSTEPEREPDPMGDLDHEAVGLADNPTNENSYGSGLGRQDLSIPRPPAKEDLRYKR